MEDFGTKHSTWGRIAALLSMSLVPVLVHRDHTQLLQSKGLGWEGVGKEAYVLLDPCQHQAYNLLTNLLICTVTELQMEKRL